MSTTYIDNNVTRITKTQDLGKTRPETFITRLCQCVFLFYAPVIPCTGTVFGLTFLSLLLPFPLADFFHILPPFLLYLLNCFYPFLLSLHTHLFPLSFVFLFFSALISTFHSFFFLFILVSFHLLFYIYSFSPSFQSFLFSIFLFPSLLSCFFPSLLPSFTSTQ